MAWPLLLNPGIRQCEIFCNSEDLTVVSDVVRNLLTRSDIARETLIIETSSLLLVVESKEFLARQESGVGELTVDGVHGDLQYAVALPCVDHALA